MSYLQREQPITLTATNRTPLPFGTGSVDMTLVDPSHRYLLIDKICIQVNSRAVANAGANENLGELIAALYEAKISTKLTSLTEDFVPLLAMSQVQSVDAESEIFTDAFSGPDPLAALNFIEWVFPRPMLLRPGEALKVTIRQSSVDVGAFPMTTAYATSGALFTAVAKGSLVRLTAPKVLTRQVPFIIAQAFDARSAQVGGGNANLQEKVLENTTKRVLNMHTLLGRWISWAGVTHAIVMPVVDTAVPFSGVLQPLVSVRDYAGYDVAKRVPLDILFPRQVGGTLAFGGAMQMRDVLKITMARDPRNGSADPLFTSTQAIVGLHAWREEPA